MKNPILTWMKQYLHFSKKDRNAILTLSILIFLSIVGHIVVNNIQPKTNLNITEVEQILNEWKTIKKHELNTKSLFSFDPNTISKKRLDSLSIPESIKDNIVRYRTAGGIFNEANDVRKIYGMSDSIFAMIENYIVISGKEKKTKTFTKPATLSVSKFKGFFDPNTAERDLLVQIGFNDFQVDNLIKYRESGGRIGIPTDLLKIYGVDTPFFAEIKDNLQIEQIEVKDDSIPKIKKLIEINGADSVQLLKLKGIGPVFSSRIIKFRELLGGFYSKKQLLEVYNFPEETYSEIVDKISVDSTLIRKIRINFADYRELITHPYFNNELVNNIIDFREENGQFHSIDQLFESGLLKSDECEKLKPYLTCR